MATLDINVRQVNADFQAIKSKIVESGVTVADGTPTSGYAEKIGEVYSAGREAEYNEFWDEYQNNGVPTGGSFLFSGPGWNESNFRPKYDIVPKKTARYMFAVTSNLQIDIEAQLNAVGVKLDTSNVTEVDGFEYFCQYAGPKMLPVINTTGCPRLRYVFANANSLETVRKFIFKNDGTQEITKILDGCTKLSHLIVEGTIGQNGFDAKWSPLDKESLISIVNALSSTTTGLTVTLSLNAVKKAFETIEGANDGDTSPEWLALAATKTNWTISLATV